MFSFDLLLTISPLAVKDNSSFISEPANQSVSDVFMPVMHLSMFSRGVGWELGVGVGGGGTLRIRKPEQSLLEFDRQL